MQNYNGQEVSRNSAINSIIRARDVNGNFKKVHILQQRGNVVNFKDEKGFNYSLPENIKVKVLAADSEKDSTLKKCWEKFGAGKLIIENYTGGAIEIELLSIENITYGWPTDSFTFFEHNIIVSLEEPEPEEKYVIYHDDHVGFIEELKTEEGRDYPIQAEEEDVV